MNNEKMKHSNQLSREQRLAQANRILWNNVVIRDHPASKHWGHTQEGLKLEFNRVLKKTDVDLILLDAKGNETIIPTDRPARCYSTEYALDLIFQMMEEDGVKENLLPDYCGAPPLSWAVRPEDWIPTANPNTN